MFDILSLLSGQNLAEKYEEKGNNENLKSVPALFPLNF